MVENKNKKLIVQILAELVLDYMSMQNSKKFSYSEYLAWIIQKQTKTKNNIVNHMDQWIIVSSCKNQLR